MNMHAGPITIRPLQDIDRLPMATLLNNKNVSDNLRDQIPFPYTENDAIDFINSMKDNPSVSAFAIVYEDAFAGTIGLIGQNDVYRKSAEIGYWLGEPFWGKGIVTSAVKLVTDFGFNHLQLARIYAAIFEFNPASMKLLEKNGYTKEGVFEKAVFKHGRFWNEHRYAIIR